MVTIIQSIIDTVGAFITGMFSWIADGIEGATSIFYVPETGLTFIGVLAMFGLAVGIVYFAINFIRGFVQK